MSTLTASAAWQALVAHKRELEPVHMRELFARDAKRADTMTREACGLYVDFSKHRTTAEKAGLSGPAAECQHQPLGSRGQVRVYG